MTSGSVEPASSMAITYSSPIVAAAACGSFANEIFHCCEMFLFRSSADGHLAAGRVKERIAVISLFL